MSLLEVKRRSESHSAVTASVLTDTVLSESLDEGVLVSLSLAIESKESAHSSDVLNPSWVFLGDAVKSISHNFSYFASIIKEIVALDKSVLVLGKKSANRVTHEGVVMTVHLLQFSVIVVIETTSLHLLCEAHEIWRSLKVKVFVSPEFSRCDDSSLDFINDHVFSHSLGSLADFVHKPA